jgi:protein-tyrosine phosphatase
MYQAMRTLSDMRYRPILAHVERFGCLKNQMGRIEELIELGIYLQTNAGSVAGGMLDEESRWSKKLLKGEYITFLGSDAHNMSNRNPDMSQAVKWLSKHVEPDYLKRLLYTYPKKMLNNEYPR